MRKKEKVKKVISVYEKFGGKKEIKTSKDLKRFFDEISKLYQ